MDIQKILAKNLKYYLDINGKMQSDISKDLNINKGVVSTWCNGTSFPRADKIMILAEYFNINFVDLFIDKTNVNRSIEELDSIASQLEPEYQAIILEQAKTLLKMQKSK